MAQDAGKLSSILAAAPIVPVIIHDDVSTARNLAEALVAGGLVNLEVTLRTPNALKVMEEMSKVKGAVVGSGTCRTKTDMQASADAGCQFMVSPGAPVALLEAADEIAIPLLPGIASPTEAMAASLMGYSYLKFFPAEAMGGAPVLKAFASPLADLKFCPTGGVSLSNAKTYLELPNVVCVGGSWVVPKAAIESGDFDTVQALAAEAAQLSA